MNPGQTGAGEDGPGEMRAQREEGGWVRNYEMASGQRKGNKNPAQVSVEKVIKFKGH